MIEPTGSALDFQSIQQSTVLTVLEHTFMDQWISRYCFNNNF